MIRIMIRIFSLTFVACAGFAAYHFNSVPLMFTSGSFLVTIQKIIRRSFLEIMKTSEADHGWCYSKVRELLT